jgi:hypothetical protein
VAFVGASAGSFALVSHQLSRRTWALRRIEHLRNRRVRAPPLLVRSASRGEKNPRNASLLVGGFILLVIILEIGVDDIASLHPQRMVQVLGKKLHACSPHPMRQLRVNAIGADAFIDPSLEAVRLLQRVV